MKAYVLVNTQIGLEGQICKEMQAIEGVTNAEIVHGVFDMIVTVEAETNEKLKEIINKKIRRTENVRSTLTMYLVINSQ